MFYTSNRKSRNAGQPFIVEKKNWIAFIVKNCTAFALVLTNGLVSFEPDGRRMFDLLKNEIE